MPAPVSRDEALPVRPHRDSRRSYKARIRHRPGIRGGVVEAIAAKRYFFLGIYRSVMVPS